VADLEWRVSTSTRIRFVELLNELRDMHATNPRHHELLDEIRSLPGFPIGADPEADLIHLNVTTERTRL
jgi:hypothetical protein